MTERAQSGRPLGALQNEVDANGRRRQRQPREVRFRHTAQLGRPVDAKRIEKKAPQNANAFARRRFGRNTRNGEKGRKCSSPDVPRQPATAQKRVLQPLPSDRFAQRSYALAVEHPGTVLREKRRRGTQRKVDESIGGKKRQALRRADEIPETVDLVFGLELGFALRALEAKVLLKSALKLRMTTKRVGHGLREGNQRFRRFRRFGFALFAIEAHDTREQFGLFVEQLRKKRVCGVDRRPSGGNRPILGGLLTPCAGALLRETRTHDSPPSVGVAPLRTSVSRRRRR